MTEISSRISPTDQTSNRRKENTAILTGGIGIILIKLLNAALGFATVTVFARLMPPETYGTYILALTVAQFLALPLQMGIPILLTREISIAEAQGRSERIQGVRAWSRRIILVGTLLLGGLVIGCYALLVATGWSVLKNLTWPLVLLIVVLIPVIAEMKRVMGILNGYRRPAQSRLPDGVVRPVLLLILGGAGLWAGWIAETGLLAIYTASGALAALAGWALVRRAESTKPMKETKETHSTDWWKSLWPLTIFAAASTFKTYTDVLMLGAMDTSAVVAFYRVAAQIAAIALLSQVAINAVLSPRIAALHVAGRRDRMQALAVKGSRISFSAALAFAVLLTLAGQDTFVLLLGADYAPTYTLAVALSFGIAASAFFGGTTMLLNMTGREKSNGKYAIWTAIGNIVLNLLLIPLLGAMGAIIATVTTNLVMQILAWRRLVRDLGLRTDAMARIRT